MDEAMEEIRTLSVKGCRLRENKDRDTKKIVGESELKNYLAKGWDVQTVLP